MRDFYGKISIYLCRISSTLRAFTKIAICNICFVFIVALVLAKVVQKQKPRGFVSLV